MSSLKLFILIFKKFIIYIYALPILFIIHLLKRIILIRFQETIVNRIGHFACHIELYLLEKKISNKKYFDIFFFGPNVCNTKLAEIWKKNIIVLPYFIIAPIFSTYRSLIKKIMGTDHIIPENISRDRDVYNLLDKFPPNIKFTKKKLLTEILY